MKKLLLIGTGTMGKEHAQAYYSMKNVHLVGIVGRVLEAEKIIGEHDTKVFETFDEAIENLDRIDCVDICVPTFLHKDYVKKAADLGINIICEKPLAYSAEDAKEMVEYCRKKQVQLFVAHVVRFFPQYKEARNLVLSGAIGEVGVVRTRRGGSFPKGVEGWYKNPEKSGGVLLDLLIHDFDFLRWTFGEVERVYAKGLIENVGEELDYALVTLVFQSGVIAHLEGTWAHQTFSTGFEIAGRSGIIEYDSLREYAVLLFSRDENYRSGGVQLPESPLKQSPYYTELEHFIDCLITGETPIVTAYDAYKAVELANAALESLKTRKPVMLNEGSEVV